MSKNWRKSAGKIISRSVYEACHANNGEPGVNNINKILTQKIATKSAEIDAFFAEKFAQFPPLFYNSVDLRHAGFKIAPVDTNCYPAGFNNIAGESKKRAIGLTEKFFKNAEKKFGAIKRILIVPENHTRNSRYLENVFRLQKIIAATGREVVVGSVNPDITEKTTISLENIGALTLHPLQKISQKISTRDGFVPDFIVLNHDLTDGIPEILRDIATPIDPAPNLGWHSRTKSNHFTIYNELAEELAKILDIDPWLISSLHRSCHDVDFKNPNKEIGGIKCLAKHVDNLVAILRQKYATYGVKDEPYCYVKSDNGTYGMAVWVVSSGSEVLEMNKKERNKMHMLKGSVQNTQVMIQEGIRTLDKIDGKIAEPMIYLINGEVAANLFRANSERDEKISLNAGGAEFFDLENLSENQLQLGVEKNDAAAVYLLIARLAALAASKENY